MNELADTKEQIRRRIDIVEFVSRYTSLKKQGRSLVGLCPFHSEKTPSFSVSPERQFFKCFGCGVGGDVFTFVQLRESVDFGAALRILADQAGVKLTGRGDRAASAGFSTADIARVNAWAAEHLQANFRHPKDGQSARTYVANRGISEKSAAQFGIGVAIDDFNTLRNAGVKQGFPPELLIESGVCKVNEDRQSIYDTFRHRLMFPIRDTMGRIIGFGGRSFDDTHPKYLNTNQTPLFDKSKCLYGMDLARDEISRSSTALIVEGYTDCIAAHQHGFINTVATLGTAATEDHFNILKRFAKTVILVFDSDNAGQTAADRALMIGLKHGLTIKLVRLPDGHDPCDLLQAIGREGFISVLNSAQEALGFKWQNVRKSFGSESSANVRREAVTQFTTLVSELCEFGTLDVIQKGVIASQVAHLLSIPISEVQPLLGGGRAGPQSRIAGPDSQIPQALSAEEGTLLMLLRALIHEPATYDRVGTEIDFDCIENGELRSVFRAVLEILASTGACELSDVLGRLESPEASRLFTDLACEPADELVCWEAAASSAMDRLAKIRRSRDLRQLGDAIQHAHANGASVDEGIQRHRLQELGKKLAGRSGFTPQRMIRTCGESEGKAQ